MGEFHDEVMDWAYSRNPEPDPGWVLDTSHRMRFSNGRLVTYGEVEERRFEAGYLDQPYTGTLTECSEARRRLIESYRAAGLPEPDLDILPVEDGEGW
jgi:hypothetical protein